MGIVEDARIIEAAQRLLGEPIEVTNRLSGTTIYGQLVGYVTGPAVVIQLNPDQRITVAAKCLTNLVAQPTPDIA